MDIFESHPDINSYAYDPYPRRLVMFTAGGKYHPGARRWLPVGGQRIEGPLEPTNQDATAGELIIRPGKEAEIQKLLDTVTFKAGVGAPGDGKCVTLPTVAGMPR